MKFLIVVDMQNDFINGSLGTAEAVAILPAVKKYIEEFEGTIIATRDTHQSNYLNTQEGKYLPVEHCIDGSNGWEIHSEISPLITNAINKKNFGSLDIASAIKSFGEPSEITLVGLCTDICVVSNALILKTAFPEVHIKVIADCCAGVTPQKHNAALEVMRSCQVDVI